MQAKTKELPYLAKVILNISTVDQQLKEECIEGLQNIYNEKISKGMRKWEADRWAIDQAIRMAWTFLPDDFKKMMVSSMVKSVPILVAWFLKKMLY
jgi:hypothetical protein